MLDNAPSVIESFAEVCNNCSFKLPMPTRSYIIDLVKERFDHLIESPEIVERSFKICSISSLDSLKVHNASLY